MKLQSFAYGEWLQSSTSGTILNNAINGEIVGQISSDGLVFKDMLDYARSIGGPALRRYAFYQRALMLKELGPALRHTGLPRHCFTGPAYL